MAFYEMFISRSLSVGTPRGKGWRLADARLFEVLLSATITSCSLKMLSTDVGVVIRHSAPMKGVRSISTQRTLINV